MPPIQWDQLEAAFKDAKETMRRIDTMSDQLAEMLCGRLRRVSKYHARKLKRELSQFNAHTERWRD